MADYVVPSVPQPGIGTTYDLPNFVGELFSLIPAETPLTSMSGGLTGGKSVNSKEFAWEVEDNAAAVVNNVALEGADPTDESIIRQQVSNVVEIHQESVAVSYTKQAAIWQLGAGDDALDQFGDHRHAVLQERRRIADGGAVERELLVGLGIHAIAVD